MAEKDVTRESGAPVEKDTVPSPVVAPESGVDASEVAPSPDPTQGSSASGAAPLSDAAPLTPADERRVLAESVERYLAYLERDRNLSPNTVRSYRIDLEAFQSWAERTNVAPLSATQRDLRRYLAELSRAGYSTTTVDRHLSSLRGLYKWMVREGVIESEAVTSLSTPKAPRTLPRTMTDEDVQALLATCDVDEPVGLRDRAFLELLYATGARISEIAALDVRSVDLAQEQVRLFGKGSKERIVPIYEVAANWVARYLDESRPVLLAKREPSRDALFISTRGNPMSADALRTCFEHHVTLAGLDPDLTPHAMRHTYATELLSGGADLRSVQELLGHESLSTTQVYTHLSVERLKDATRYAHPRADTSAANPVDGADIDSTDAVPDSDDLASSSSNPANASRIDEKGAIV